MPQPTPYERLYNLTQYATDNTANPYNAAQHDAEFDAVEETLGGICDNLRLIQRDDGALKNAIVTPRSLSGTTLAMIANWNVRGEWVVFTDYAIKDFVEFDGVGYLCLTAHTSTDFATQLALGYWLSIDVSMAALAADDGATLVANQYDAVNAVSLNLHEYIEDDGAYNVMGFVPQNLKSSIRAFTSTADLETYIQSVGDAIMDRGAGCIAFPYGQFHVGAPVLVDGWSGIHVRGVGYGSRLRSPDKIYFFANAPGSADTTNDCEWSHLAFVGTYGPSSPDYGTVSVVGQTAIYLNTTAPVANKNNHVHHIRFVNMAGGVYATKAENLKVTDSFFYGCLAEIQIGSGGVNKGNFSGNIIEAIEGVICDDAIAIFGPSMDLKICHNECDRKNTTGSTVIGQKRIILGGLAGATMTRVLIGFNTIKNNANANFAGFSDAARASIAINADTTGVMSEIDVLANQIYNGMNGVTIFNSGTATVSGVRGNGNTINTMQKNGINGPNGGTNLDWEFLDNEITSVGDRGISCALVSKLKYGKNRVRSAGGLGIVTDQCTNFSSSDDEATGGASDGFRIAATPYAHIQNFVSESNGGWGLQFTGASANPNVTARRMSSNSSGNVTGLTTQTTAVADDTTPSVRNLDLKTLLFGANTGATAITQLDDGFPNMTVELRGTSATNASTIADGGNFKLTAAITLTTDTSIILTTTNGTTWIERSRAVN